MKIAIASDHAGFPLKEEVREHVAKLGYGIGGLRAYNTEPSDYPDFIANEPRFMCRLNKAKAIEEQYMPSVAGMALSA